MIYPNPGYPIYESAINWSGATRGAASDHRGDRLRVHADDLAERLTPRTRMVILNSPANPTGGALDRELNVEIARILADHDCWILTDEVYSELLYEGVHDTVAAHGLLDRTILLDGFSKTYAMTGWRLGYAAVPPALIEPLSRFLINSVACTAPAVQLAGVAALTGPHDAIDAMVAEFVRRREVLVEGLNRLPGVSCVMPRGAFYAFPNVTGTGIDERTLARPAARRGRRRRAGRARISARTGRGISGSRTPTRSSISRRRWSRWAACSRPSRSSPWRRGSSSRGGSPSRRSSFSRRRATSGSRRTTGRLRQTSCTPRWPERTGSSRSSTTGSTTRSSMPPAPGFASWRTPPWGTTTSTSPRARAEAWS